MDKVSLGIQIVAMRKGVRAAKRSFMKSEARAIKVLEDRIKKAEEKESGDFHTKLKRQVQNRKKELDRISSLVNDDVSKYALEKITDLKEIIGDPKTSPGDRLLAKVAKHTSVQKDVQNFRKTHPDSEEWLKPLLDLWAEKKKIRAENGSELSLSNPQNISGEAKLVGKKKIQSERPGGLKVRTPPKSSSLPFKATTNFVVTPLVKEVAISTANVPHSTPFTKLKTTSGNQKMFGERNELQAETSESGQNNRGATVSMNAMEDKPHTTPAKVADSFFVGSRVVNSKAAEGFSSMPNFRSAPAKRDFNELDNQQRNEGWNKRKDDWVNKKNDVWGKDKNDSWAKNKNDKWTNNEKVNWPSSDKNDWSRNQKDSWSSNKAEATKSPAAASNSETMHPSWEAKRRQKELLTMVAKPKMHIKFE